MEQDIKIDTTENCWKCGATLNEDGTCPNGCPKYADIFGEE